MKITNKDTRLADRVLLQLGYERAGATGSGHHLYRHPGEGWTYTLAASPSDHRWLENFWSDMARTTGVAKHDLIARMTGERRPGSSTRAKRSRRDRAPRRPVASFQPPAELPALPVRVLSLAVRLGLDGLSLDQQIEEVSAARWDAHRHRQGAAAAELSEELDRLYAIKRGDPAAAA